MASGRDRTTRAPCKWVSTRRTSARLFRLGENGDGLQFHCGQASEQKSCRKPLSIDLAVYLVGRFFDSIALEPPSQFLVAQFALRHPPKNQFLRPFFPLRVGRLRRRYFIALRFVHLSFSDHAWHLLF